MLLLRLSLVVAIIASIATFVVGELKVKERINVLTTDLDTTRGNLEQMTSQEAKARADAKKVRAELDTTSRQLGEAQESLQTARTDLGVQRKRADELATNLDTTTKAKNVAEQKLTQWEVLGVTPEQVRGIQNDLRLARESIDMANEEKKVLVRNNNTLRAELEKYTVGEDSVPPLPAGLKGKVLAVDPKYDFVVVDLGEEHGIVPRGELLVNRDGKLVAKIRILRVEPKRCIANILPQWKQADVMEGDQILN